jgi:hypothetical protein
VSYQIPHFRNFWRKWLIFDSSVFLATSFLHDNIAVDLHLNGLGEWNQTRVSGPIIAQGRLGIGQFIPLSGNGRSNLA